MTKRAVTVLVGILLIVAPDAFAQQKTITGKVTDQQNAPLAGVVVAVKGSNRATTTNTAGIYSIGGEVGQVLQFRMIGTELAERTVSVSMSSGLRSAARLVKSSPRLLNAVVELTSEASTPVLRVRLSIGRPSTIISG